MPEENNNPSRATELEVQRRIVLEQISNIYKKISEYQKDAIDNNVDNTAAIEDLQVELNKALAEEEKISKELQNQIKSRQRSVDITKQLSSQLKAGWKYLQEQDKIIKSTVLSLGMSSAKAVAMRDAFEKSAGYVTRLGGSIGDIQAVMQGYADETGRARVLSAEMVKDITTIGKGTGLGIEQATKLGAQFELVGLNARTTVDYVQGVVDTSERMGVNTTKVLKNINDNFKRLNTYTFQQGVRGFAEMAQFAEKFKIDINQALNAADISRTLEGAIDLTAQLQVMGGEFAKTDPFQMLFLSRNDPAKFTEKIADMTKGVVSFRKMADGTFEKFISPADRDRLAAVAKSMGMEASALTEIAQRQAEIQKMRSEMAGLGLSEEQKKLIEGAAMFDAKSGRFQVQLAGTMRNLSDLTSTQAKSFAQEQVLLEERAKQAMTFDETFKATIETLKSNLLPLLQGINSVLNSKVVQAIPDFFSTMNDTFGKTGGIAASAGILMSAGLLWRGISNKFSNATTNFVEKKGGKGIASYLRKKPLTGGGTSTAATSVKGAGGKALGKGAGVGLAGAGIGAGVMMGAQGIADLAQAIKDVDTDKLKAMNGTIAILGGTLAGITIGVAALGAAGTAAAPGILAVGAAAVGIGFGINLATKGIGEMANGLGNMFDKIKGAGPDMAMAAGGIAGIASALGAATLTLPSAIGLSLAIAKIGKNGGDLVKVGAAMEKITTVLSGNRDDFEAVEKAVRSISDMKIKGGGQFAELARLLKQPLKVTFDKETFTIKNDITLEIDRDKFMHKVYDAKVAVQLQEGLRTGY